MTPNQTDVLAILAQHVQCPHTALDRASVLTDLGLDSLKFIVVVLDIERRLQRSIFDIGNVGSMRTVGDILDLVGAA